MCGLLSAIEVAWGLGEEEILELLGGEKRVRAPAAKFTEITIPLAEHQRALPGVVRSVYFWAMRWIGAVRVRRGS
jgi:hypothetical protein